jgi:hypothetical protein
MYIIFLYGCSTNSSWDNAKEAGKTGTSGLQDSLKQMDSLLDLNKIRNNLLPGHLRTGHSAWP